MTTLKTYIVTLKDSVSDTDVAAIKKKISDMGGSISSEFSLFKGFVIKLSSDTVHTLSGHEHVKSIEEDKEVHIQQ